MLKLTLPWPPSVNKRLCHRKGQRKMFLSRWFKDYYKNAEAAIRAQLKFKHKTITEPVDQILTFHPPDKRRRDSDNYLKAVNDALTHADVVEDDSIFRDRLTRWREPVENGRVDVVLGQIKFNAKEVEDDDGMGNN